MMRPSPVSAVSPDPPSPESLSGIFLADLEDLPARAPAPTVTGGEQRLGLRMGDVFALAKQHMAMAPEVVEVLLKSPIYEARLGAVSIMDFQARSRRTSESHRRELYELYLRRHDGINDWGLVDRAAPSVIGDHLLDKPRDPLYELARSANRWERRTAIVATWAFIRRGELDDAFALGGMLAADPEHFVQTAVGGWVREAGKRDEAALLRWLDEHAAGLSAIGLRFATEKLDRDTAARYRARRSGG
jgi:3-methyladenine DNA glycosylase AlkD